MSRARDTADLTGGLTVSGTTATFSSSTVAGPATFTLDPAVVGNATGTLVVEGNLTVKGTTTTIDTATTQLSLIHI